MTLALTIHDLLTPLALFGFAGQFMFMLRFLVQWYASERRRRSVIPIGFWYLSIVGGLMLLVYATIKQDPVFMFGQALGLAIYVRNLMLIYRRRARMRRTAGARTPRRSVPEAIPLDRLVKPPRSPGDPRPADADAAAARLPASG